MTEKELKKAIKQAQTGDEIAFNTIILSFKNDFFRIAKSRLLNDDDATDAVQETIINIYLSLHKLKQIDKFKTWAIKILINNCNSIYNSKKRKHEQNYQNLYEIENINIGDVTDYDNILENLLKSFPIEEKTIITLFYVEEYTSKEIGKILNMNTNTVKTKLLRIKNKIKSIYGKELI